MRRMNGFVLAGALLAAPLLVQAAGSTGSAPPSLEQRVWHELLMLPYYNVFDNLSFQVDGSRVVLMGEVARPTLKSDAGNVVRRIPGVTGVTNNIEVLPLSPFDNRVRVAEYRAIFGRDGLYRYAMGALPSIHIIVKNGHVTLEGVVNSQADRNLAGLYANSVFGVFSVTNHLRVVKS
jgi:hyperosmotically inducible periplasmic protein